MIFNKTVDVLIVGAGPSGSAAAFYASQSGLEVLLIDTAPFPRDKTCGDGLTPRAIHQLERMGIAEQITAGYVSNGLKLHGFGGSVTAPWPSSDFGTRGSAMRRTELDHLLLQHAATQPGVEVWQECAAQEPLWNGSSLSGVTVLRDYEELSVGARWVIVADGVRSTFGKKLGREWHKGEVYGIAARSYCPTPMSTEPWIHSHLELKDDTHATQPGYGWIFPLGNGYVNLGCGALSTDKRPAKINTKKLLESYAGQVREEWQLGPTEAVASALLPMGGAVSNVAGPNWMLIGDAAACVNPLNGEGIDYGLESAELAVSLLKTQKDLTFFWPLVLREQYGDAFTLARTLARALTYPQFLPMVGPLGFRGPQANLMMNTAARLMGNLVTENDHDLVARVWRATGRGVERWSTSPLWS